MDRLLEGYRRFRAEAWPADRARYEALAKYGQKPETLVVSCSDSRVDPQTIFGAVPGEMFVVRNVAALVPPYHPDRGCHGTSAALEFGVKALKVARIIVLGHAQCGGVQAMVAGAPPGLDDFLAPWVGMASAALEVPAPDPAHPLPHYETEIVRLSLANLMTFPWIASGVESGVLSLAGFRFDIHTGILSRLSQTGFEPVT